MSAATSTVGKFVWHEQVSGEPKKAQDFYTRLFGWGTEVYGPGDADYTMIATNGQTHGGFGQAMEGAPPPHWLSHVRVENLDETIEKAKAAGGRLAAGPFEMGEIGRIGILQDPQGAFISAYEPGGEGSMPEGVFVWDELGTTDVDGAQRFYEAVFGWTAVDPGPDFGGYRIFNRGETGVAGFMANPDPSIPAGWKPYIGVDDADASAAKAKELGATIIAEPMDIPTVGRFAIIQDPQGAIFGILKPTPGS